jgi:hypothetical protein
MNNHDRWQKSNDAYLAAALNWLRLRLTGLAAATERAADNAAPPAPDRGTIPSPGCETPTEKSQSEAAAKIKAAETADPPPALMIMGQRFALSRFERQVLLLCAAMELDTRIAGLCARAQDDPGRAYPTFALALVLFDNPAWDALSPERPLRHFRLIEINRRNAEPLTAAALMADERIAAYIKGLNYLDHRLTQLLAPVMATPGSEPLPPSQKKAVETIIHHLGLTASDGRPPAIQLVGPDPLSKQLVACHTAAALGLNIYRLAIEQLPAQAGELETVARLWQREAVLLPIALYLDARELGKNDGSGDQAAHARTLARFLARSNGLFFVETRDIQPDLGRCSVIVDIAKPTPGEQQTAWTAALNSNNGSKTPARLAGQFNLNLAAIHGIAREAGSRKQPENEPIEDHLWRACLEKTRPRLDTLAQRIEPKAVWDDIVLPHEQMDLLRQITAQVDQRNQVYDAWGFRRKMNRGMGISVLFAGDSGTGKTMAAEVIANHLRLNLYRIDLSNVVNKYIGETEKNLRRLFDTAEDGGVILFFDEADALFGKRSEVKDSHDRYANIEVNYLLQRMESFSGLAVLATNMKSHLDTAFLRRLRFIVNFPFPDTALRRRIWQKVFPSRTPTTDLDNDRLARLNLSGGNIHNIALNAAFLAAQTDTPVTMPQILASARAELRKLDRPVNSAELR